MTSDLNFSFADEISHLALDMGGSLIKLVYLSRSNSTSEDQMRPLKESCGASNGSKDLHLLNGRLQFMKFENSRINECIEFISSMQLHGNGVRQHEAPLMDNNVIKATGGGAFKFADLFREKLGITLDEVDEVTSLVAGANFLLKVYREERLKFSSLFISMSGVLHLIYNVGSLSNNVKPFNELADHSEAFTYMDGRRHYLQIDHKDLYPFLLVIIGTAVGMVKVEGAGKFQLVDITSIGGSTFMGLGRLLTQCKSFDELVELSHQGNDSVLAIRVRDICGEKKFADPRIGSTLIASNFGKPVSENKELVDYRPEDIAASLLTMISKNIGQIAHLNASRFGLKNIFFGGSFLQHDYTVDSISKGVAFSSYGASKAMFLRHDGFLGALGAFMSYQNLGLDDLMTRQLIEEPRNARLKGENFHGPLVGDVKEN